MKRISALKRQNSRIANPVERCLAAGISPSHHSGRPRMALAGKLEKATPRDD
jgi:hypothetical protein